MSAYAELLKQQEELALKIEEARQKEVGKAVEKIKDLVTTYGLTASDIFSTRRSSSSKPASKVAPKYRDPATGTTWTGRGREPKWIEGQDRAKYEIQMD